LLTMFMIIILLITKVLVIKQRELKASITVIKAVLTQLNQIFSFALIADSRFTGFFLFMLSNLITGLINLSINTMAISDTISFSVLCFYSLVAFAIPFYFYFMLNTKK
jgi:hypothetical protein